MEVWDIGSGMCSPLAMQGMPMSMFMIHGNGFASAITESGPRGRSDIAAPNMLMLSAGTSVGDSNYLAVDFMGTLERWTLPYAGSPLLLQIGEANSQGVAFLDAQHPHSSPIMGLTLSDTFRFAQDSKDHLKIFFAPRGESTDGPVAFMHRPTGMVNPDAPLGHHIGQDVGHISSTVLGASVEIGETTFQGSFFNGAEPLPDAVDLPMGPLNSTALRLIHEFNKDFTAMISWAEIKNTEPGAADTFRYSTSFYTEGIVWSDLPFYNTLIYGMTTNYDGASSLTSFAEEFLIGKKQKKLWGRLEVLQRTPGELQVTSVSNQNTGEWVQALTLGFTRELATFQDAELSTGASATVYSLPSDFVGPYGSANPTAAKIFLQWGGMRMVDL